MGIKTIAVASTGLLFQRSNTEYRMKDSNARFLIKGFFFVKNAASKTRFS